MERASVLRKASSAFTEIGGVIMFAWLLFHPEQTGESVRNAISFCASVIIPSLFVFLVLSRLLVAKILSVSGRLFPLSLILCGIVCGFPFGAKTVNELFRNGMLSRKQAELLVSCTNNASASFIVSFVGASVLGSVRAGAFLLLGKLGVTLVWYAVVSRAWLRRDEPRIVSIGAVKSVSVSEALRDAARAMAEICACIVFFMCVGDILSSMLPPNGIIKSLISGAIELSGGIASCRTLSTETAYITAAGLLGWSGMCVHMQVSLSSDKAISLRLYFLNKFTECLVMILFGILTSARAL